MNCNSPGSSVHEILQARLLEWAAIPFPRVSSQPRDQTWVSRIAGRFFTIGDTGGRDNSWGELCYALQDSWALLIRCQLQLPSHSIVTTKNISRYCKSPPGENICPIWDSESWWWTGRPGMLQFMESQRVGHDWATELNWAENHQSNLPYSKLSAVNESYLLPPEVQCVSLNLTLIDYKYCS